MARGKHLVPLHRRHRLHLVWIATMAVICLVAVGVGGLLHRSSSDPAHDPSAHALSPASQTKQVDRAVGWTVSTYQDHFGKYPRWYLVQQPTGLNSAQRHRLPLLLMIPGRNETPGELATASRITEIGPAVIIYVVGLHLSWNAGGGDSHWWSSYHRVNDAGYLSQVVHRVQKTNSWVNPTKTFVAGFSDGGRMGFRLACENSQLFTGFAALESVPVYDCPHPLSHPLSILMIDRGKDPVLSFGKGGPKVSEGVLQPTVPGTVALWTKLDRCSTGKVTTSTKGNLTLRQWACADHTTFSYAYFAGATGHSWTYNETGTGTPGGTSLIAALVGQSPENVPLAWFGPLKPKSGSPISTPGQGRRPANASYLSQLRDLATAGYRMFTAGVARVTSGQSGHNSKHPGQSSGSTPSTTIKRRARTHGSTSPGSSDSRHKATSTTSSTISRGGGTSSTTSRGTTSSTTSRGTTSSTTGRSNSSFTAGGRSNGSTASRSNSSTTNRAKGSTSGESKR